MAEGRQLSIEIPQQGSQSGNRMVLIKSKLYYGRVASMQARADVMGSREKACLEKINFARSIVCLPHICM